MIASAEKGAHVDVGVLIRCGARREFRHECNREKHKKRSMCKRAKLRLSDLCREGLRPLSVRTTGVTCLCGFHKLTLPRATKETFEKHEMERDGQVCNQANTSLVQEITGCWRLSELRHA